MPLPTPKANEGKEAFISRCMETITKEERNKWPNEKQRAAICYSQWNRWQRENAGPLENEATAKSDEE